VVVSPVADGLIARGDVLVRRGHREGHVAELARLAHEHVDRRGIRREVHDAQARGDVVVIVIAACGEAQRGNQREAENA
jgi:hypothetical protein